ncbi:SMP-30/gluconolactonase/LRE family protein [Spirosoma agri]|uniref:Gluconolaconase n=1 Tax=Spirosoma agri TaxID=1987381 RepID=A0A6M0IE82_9BACT|nr:SMP-30/gluconolactonase/LRE family protein [Spirosoma agri]NEU66586.1 gluconolaconase [Spirosoma agri]
MNVSPKNAYCLAVLAGTLAACNTPDPEFDAPIFPERIAFSAARQYPEGITYAPSLDKFLVSSITQGKIGTVDQNGRYADLIAQDSALISSIGMKVRDGKLYVCNGDQGVSSKSTSATTLKTAGLFIYDLATRTNLRRVNLAALLPGSNHYANDLAFDSEGNAYVTDSFAPVIYKVPADTTKPSILVNSPLFAGTEGINLNGIVYHPDKFLIVAKANEGSLYKVSLSAPTLPKQITGPALPNGDGMVLVGDDLYVVNNRNRVSRVRSSDGWNTFTIVESDASGYDQATTCVDVNGKIFTLNARISEVSAAVAAKNPAQLQASDYSIKQFKSTGAGN